MIVSFPCKRESRYFLLLWILAGVYPRESGGGNDKKPKNISTFYKYINK